jgi:CHAT domain-containing protein/uncharacterized protein HemY
MFRKSWPFDDLLQRHRIPSECKFKSARPAREWRSKGVVVGKRHWVGRAILPSRPTFQWAQLFLALNLALTIPALSQDHLNAQVRTEQDLIAAILKAGKAGQTTIETLLNEHQPLVTQSLWEQLIKVAASAYYMRSADKALEIYDASLLVATHLKDKRCVAATHYNIGRTYSSMGKVGEAIRAYIESKTVFEAAGLRRDLIYILSDLGSLYFYAQDYKQARACSEESVALVEELKDSDVRPGAWPDSFGVAGAFSTLGALCQREGNYADAIEYFQKSITLYEKLGDGDVNFRIGLADNFASLARVHRTTGDNGQALLLFNKALDIASGLPNRDRAAGILNSLGVLYLEQEDYAKAIVYLNQSLQSYLTQRNPTETAMVLLNLGVVYQRQEEYERAFECFTKAARQAEASADKEILINAGQGIGVILRAKGDYAAALTALERSLSLADELGDQTRTAELLWRKAEVFFEMGNFGEAARLSENSLEIARRLHLPKHSYLAATMLGKALLKDRKADLAYQALTWAIEQIESMRFSVAGREQERQLYFEDKVAAYHLMVDLLIEQGKPSEALLFAEKAKGRVLFDAMGGGGKRAPLSEKEREEERRLNQAILNLNDEIRIERTKATPDKKRIAQLTSLLESARLKYESFLNLVNAAHPESRIGDIRAPSLALEDLGRLIPDSKTTMLEYVVTKERVYLFVLTRPDRLGSVKVKTYTIPISQMNLADRVKRAHQMAAERNPAFTIPSRELYNLLIKPAEAQLRGMTTICVLPDGPLWEIPFQALKNGEGRYLIERFAIHYAPSLAVLKEIVGKKVSNAKYDSLLAIAAPRIPEERIVRPKETAGESSFDPLPGAVNEVKSLAQIFGLEHSKLFIGEEANERIFRSMAGSFGVLHFATHGMIFNRQPLYSYLLLSRDVTAVADDGLLEAREIMGLDLRADLVVLSACETARGRVSAGEGVVGISWAFFVAGCQATVVSQWKVGSSVTSDLMIHFYRGLKRNEGASKADALRMAALKVMKDGRYRHPFYWAGFIIVGDK